ncbi:MAG: NUDIX domain-containing protein [Acidobacteria bacterium]|nr:MAG: NUDIX domain-containing protein [Acidobacteriota bacterium]
MARVSAGILLYRRGTAGIEVLLVHPGGPFWVKKDAGAWMLPKGELHPDEEPLAGAQREFAEETGIRLAADASYMPLGEVRQRSGKTVIAFALESDCDPRAIRSNTFEIEWPPRSGKQQQFPEIDRAAFFTLAEAHEKILPSEAAFLDRLNS